METWEILALLICQIFIQIITLFKTGRFNAIIRNSLKTMVSSGESSTNASVAQAIHTLAARISDFETKLNLRGRNKEGKRKKRENPIPSESIAADLQHLQDFFKSIDHGGKTTHEEKKHEEEDEEKNEKSGDSGSEGGNKTSSESKGSDDIIDHNTLRLEEQGK